MIKSESITRSQQEQEQEEQQDSLVLIQKSKLELDSKQNLYPVMFSSNNLSKDALEIAQAYAHALMFLANNRCNDGDGDLYTSLVFSCPQTSFSGKWRGSFDGYGKLSLFCNRTNDSKNDTLSTLKELSKFILQGEGEILDEEFLLSSLCDKITSEKNSKDGVSMIDLKSSLAEAQLELAYIEKAVVDSYLTQCTLDDDCNFLFEELKELGTKVTIQDILGIKSKLLLSDQNKSTLELFVNPWWRSTWTPKLLLQWINRM